VIFTATGNLEVAAIAFKGTPDKRAMDLFNLAPG